MGNNIQPLCLKVSCCLGKEYFLETKLSQTFCYYFLYVPKKNEKFLLHKIYTCHSTGY